MPSSSIDILNTDAVIIHAAQKEYQLDLTRSILHDISSGIGINVVGAEAAEVIFTAIDASSVHETRLITAMRQCAVQLQNSKSIPNDLLDRIAVALETSGYNDLVNELGL